MDCSRKASCKFQTSRSGLTACSRSSFPLREIKRIWVWVWENHEREKNWVRRDEKLELLSRVGRESPSSGGVLPSPPKCECHFTLRGGSHSRGKRGNATVSADNPQEWHMRRSSTVSGWRHTLLTRWLRGHGRRCPVGCHRWGAARLALMKERHNRSAPFPQALSVPKPPEQV